MTCNNFAEDKKGAEFVYESYEMAKRSHLYDEPADNPIYPLNIEDGGVKAAASATAWGSFNWQMNVLINNT
jgi:hypothetical protein